MTSGKDENDGIEEMDFRRGCGFFGALSDLGICTDENGGGSWERRLPPGQYQLILTAAQSPGTLTVAVNYP